MFVDSCWLANPQCCCIPLRGAISLIACLASPSDFHTYILHSTWAHKTFFLLIVHFFTVSSVFVFLLGFSVNVCYYVRVHIHVVMYLVYFIVCLSMWLNTGDCTVWKGTDHWPCCPVLQLTLNNLTIQLIQPIQSIQPIQLIKQTLCFSSDRHSTVLLLLLTFNISTFIIKFTILPQTNPERIGHGQQMGIFYSSSFFSLFLDLKLYNLFELFKLFKYMF